MRTFFNLSEAVSEIRRDVAKGTPLVSSRVQNKMGDFPGRERLAYTYSVDVIPPNARGLANLGAEMGFKPYLEHYDRMVDWLEEETNRRLSPELYLEDPADFWNSALASVYEGDYPSYTYAERMLGALPAMTTALRKHPDSRRAFWPLFRPEDSLRSGAPTRIPCSLGYSAIIRKVGVDDRLILTYMERSCDFDTFWLSDVYFARRFQQRLADELDVRCGQLVHFIISLHSFEVEGTEVY